MKSPAPPQSSTNRDRKPLATTSDFVAVADLDESDVVASGFLSRFVELCGGAGDFMRFLCGGARVAF